MCFRPSAVTRNDNIQQANCPTCGMPVAAEPGVTSGTCPYCGDPIPADPTNADAPFDPSQNTRIL